jgi:iron complex outermembrane receptor protein
MAGLFVAMAAQPVLAQDNEEELEEVTFTDEVVVTGRKRDENLIEVPVSISVFGAQEIADRGILSQADLFEATPGLTFDINTDGRQGVNPGVRGVQSELIATNQQKVNAFVDGLPMLGSTGVLQFDGVDAVEVYRGPQSAAFGRATFAGAINYVTADAEDEFGGRAEVRFSDQGEQQALLAITGPIGDSLGYRLQYLKGEWSGPDEWTSTDGVELGAEETEQFSGKLNFEFSDSAYGEIMYTRLETNDISGTNMPLDPANCSGDSGIWRNNMGVDTQMFSGKWNCNPSIPSGGIPRNHNPLTQFQDQFNDDADYYYKNNVAMNNMGNWEFLDTNNDGILQADEYLAQVLPGDLGTYEQALLSHYVSNPRQDTVRDRFQGELNFEIGDGLLKIMGMYVDETLDRWFETDNTDSLGSFGVNMMTMQASLNANVMSMAVFNEISEEYAEIRWVSPDDGKLRYTLSGSYYSYDLEGQVYNSPGALIYELVAPNGNPMFPAPGISNSEVATNFGVAFGLQYDVTEATTLSFEGRYQEDENCGTASFNGTSEKACQTTDAFLPRLAVSHAFNDNHIGYAQFSIGNNPAGVNIAYADPGNIEALLVASGQIVNPADGFIYDGTDGVHFPTVEYDASTFLEFEEETLTNFEIGSKGTYADGKGTYAIALYYMFYEDMINAQNLDWDDTDVDGWNETNWTTFTGERTWINEGDGEFFGLELAGDFDFTDVWSVGGYATISEAKYDEFCSNQAPQYRDAPGGAGGGGNFVIPILSPGAGDDVLFACGDVSGNWIPRQSRFTANMDLRARLPSPLMGLETQFRLDVRHQGSYYADHMNLQEHGSLTTMNLSAIMRNDNWNVRIFVNNLTDEDTPQNVTIGNFYSPNPDPSVAAISSGSWFVVQRRPREIGAVVTYNFGG